jgi:Animal haem peroxidase
MKGALDTVKDGADPEENLLLPAGYTYFGQFIDHDLTFDNTSSLNPGDTAGATRIPTNLRTPRFDLDSLYGDGPDAHPFMYAEDGASLLFKDSFENQSQTNYDQAHQDLLRSPNGRAIIGDKRNDENSIVSQIHLAFVRYHNAVVKHLSRAERNLTGTALFDRARNQVRWTYQKLVIEDFLPRIVKEEVLKDLKNAVTPEARKHFYALYTPDKRSNLPREFVVAAYRFGHSGVRTGYRLNSGKRLSIFPSSEPRKPDAPPIDSLLGFDPLPKDHVIDDWRRFFPNATPSHPACTLGPEANGDVENPSIRLQFAYKIDCTLVDPLGVLPPQTLPTSNKVGGVLSYSTSGSYEVQSLTPHPSPLIPFTANNVPHNCWKCCNAAPANWQPILGGNGDAIFLNLIELIR